MELNISSSKINNVNDILNLFVKLNIEVQVIETKSTIKNCNNRLSIESGYKIKIYKYNRDTFKEIVWKALKDKFHLECAFIKVENEYMGCILNWPEVFTPSKCSGKKIDVN